MNDIKQLIQEVEQLKHRQDRCVKAIEWIDAYVDNGYKERLLSGTIIVCRPRNTYEFPARELFEEPHELRVLLASLLETTEARLAVLKPITDMTSMCIKNL